MGIYLIVVILFLGIIFSVKTRKLTRAGSVTGGVIGFLVYLGAGYTGFILMTTFFVLGSAVTAWKKDWKSTITCRDESQRTAGQVLANAGVAGVLAVAAMIIPENRSLFLVMMASVFSSATADTVSSELGMVYGRRFYNILSFKRDTRGLDGVISLEGTMIGVLGSGSIAATYALMEGWGLNIAWIIIAGTTGNLADSLLGAGLERKYKLNNNAVNLLNTAVAGIAAWILVKYGAG